MKVGLAGFGNVGKELTRRLNAGALREAELVAVCARDLEKAKAEAQTFTPPPRVVDLKDLPALCDVVIECATADSFPQIARAVLCAASSLYALVPLACRTVRSYWSWRGFMADECV